MTSRIQGIGVCKRVVSRMCGGGGGEGGCSPIDSSLRLSIVQALGKPLVQSKCEYGGHCNETHGDRNNVHQAVPYSRRGRFFYKLLYIYLYCFK